jgi:pimeloyl-ACP methyl ester carboxylesterase
MQTVIENVAVFGQFGGLVGIVSERADDAVRAEEAAPVRPAIIILNTGIVHRVGVGRLATVWARRLASAGHCVLRFDLSGIGDSERRDDTLSPADGAMADVRDAVDWLQSARAIQRVILIGICSGADLALLYARSDSRVGGLVIIDPSTPPTRWHNLKKCFNHKVWMRKFDAIVSVLKAQRAQPNQAISMDVWKYDSLPLSDPRVHSILADAYRSAFAQGVRILAVFTQGAAWYNYRRQLFDAFPEIDFDGKLHLEYMERCDHIITHEINRARLFGIADAWMQRTEFKVPIVAPDPCPATAAQSAAESDDLISVEF